MALTLDDTTHEKRPAATLGAAGRQLVQLADVQLALVQLAEVQLALVQEADVHDADVQEADVQEALVQLAEVQLAEVQDALVQLASCATCAFHASASRVGVPFSSGATNA